MKKLYYLIALVLVLGFIVAGCTNPAVPPAEQSELDNQTKDGGTVTVKDSPTVTLTLLDQDGNGVPGGKVKPAYGGSWGSTLSGQTDNDGKLCTTELAPGFSKILMTVNQGSQEQSLVQLAASNYTWHTVPLTIELRDDQNALITDSPGGGMVRQGGGYWYPHGYTGDSLPYGQLTVQLFPRSADYKFEMSYNHTSQTKYPTVLGATTLTFQTGKVTINCAAGTVKLAHGGWHSYSGYTVLQLLPGTYKYGGACGNGTIPVTAGEQVTIPITTNQPPVINSVTSNPSQLWPPNHKAVDVVISVDASDPDGEIVGITYSVADEYGIYDVAETDLPEDGVISLIAERDGKDKDGRIYTITVTVYDAEGLSDSKSVEVVVPHDQGKKGK